MRNREISSEILLKTFRYENGKIFRLKSAGRVSAGSEAGSELPNGYLRTKVCGVDMYVHRIVWIMHNGEIPFGMHIDHINHNRKDNRVQNLRLVTNGENHKNTKLCSRNSSGVCGVSFSKRHNKWWARINVDRKFINLGMFDDINSAIEAREKAEKFYGFHENHGRRM